MARPSWDIRDVGTREREESIAAAQRAALTIGAYVTQALRAKLDAERLAGEQGVLMPPSPSRALTVLAPGDASPSLDEIERVVKIARTIGRLKGKVPPPMLRIVTALLAQHAAANGVALTMPAPRRRRTAAPAHIPPAS